MLSINASTEAAISLWVALFSVSAAKLAILESPMFFPALDYIPYAYGKPMYMNAYLSFECVSLLSKCTSVFCCEPQRLPCTASALPLTEVLLR